MQRVLRLFLAAFVFGATGCGEANPITPKGAVVVDWNVAKATRVPFRNAKVGTHTSKDYKVTFTNGDAPFTVSVHVETAPVEYTEGTTDVHDVAPVVIRVTVDDNAAWNVFGACQEGPNYNMPSIGKDGGFEYVPGILQDCTVHYQRTGGFMRQSSWSLGTTINVESAKPPTLFPDSDGKVASM